MDQNERAFQKQDAIFIGRARQLTKGKKALRARYTRNAGLGFKAPKEAVEGTYVDKKCPFTSDVNIRGRMLKGIVKTTKMKNTCIIRRDYLHYITKYKRYEKRHKNVAVHVSPCFRLSEGDAVLVGQCRPLSKTVRFNLLKIERSTTTGKGVKLFNKF